MPSWGCSGLFIYGRRFSRTMSLKYSGLQVCLPDVRRVWYIKSSALTWSHNRIAGPEGGEMSFSKPALAVGKILRLRKRKWNSTCERISPSDRKPCILAFALIQSSIDDLRRLFENQVAVIGMLRVVYIWAHRWPASPQPRFPLRETPVPACSGMPPSPSRRVRLRKLGHCPLLTASTGPGYP